MTKSNPFERPDPERVPSHVELPELAYVVSAGDTALVIVKRGELGFYPYGPASPHNQSVADELNARMGVTKAQAAAMEFGSLFGWHVPGANPANYDEDGKLIRRPKAS